MGVKQKTKLKRKAAWYQRLLKDCKNIIIKERIDLIKRKHELGVRVLKEKENIPHGDLVSFTKKVAADLGMGWQEIYRCTQFTERFPSFEDFLKVSPVGETSWRKVKNEWLAEHHPERFSPRFFNIWNFSGCDPAFGKEGFPGRIPGQLVQNLLFFYTEPGQLIVDPMAGGGTTIDVCGVMNRRCLAYDNTPARKDIECHDVRKGYPHEAKGCYLIFLDPPYWRLKRGEYSRASVSASSYKGWLRFMRKLAEDSFKTVRKGGHVGLLIEAFLDEQSSNPNRFLDLPFECLNFFTKAGFEEVQRVMTPMPTQIKSPRDVNYAKEKRLILDLNRDLIIFRK